MDNKGLIALWVRDETRRGLRPRSVRRRQDVLHNLSRFLRGSLLDATVEDLHGWLEDVPRVPRTVHAYLSAAVGFYCWAVTSELTDVNPAAKIPRPKVRPGLPRPMRADDVTSAVRQASPMVACWLLLAAYAGLRCQEIAGLDRDDVWDFEIPVMLHVVHGKGGRERVVPLHPAILAALRAMPIPRTGPLFRSGNGRPFTPENLSHVANEYLRRVGVTSTMHQARHRFGTDVYRASRDIRLTQDLLGHQSPVTTAIYTQTSPLDAVAVVNGLSIG